jgi:hypothetical protein
VALAGASIRGGRVLGATDAQGHEVADRPEWVRDRFATIDHALGINPNRENLIGTRPVKIIEGDNVVKELFA